MQVTIDRKSGSAYIALVREIPAGGVVRTEYTFLTSEVLFDYDAQGRLVGIEFLDLKKLHPDLAEGGEHESHDR